MRRLYSDVAAALALAWGVAGCGGQRDAEPLVTSPSARLRQPPPADTLVMRAADAAAIESPFVRQPRPAGEGPGDIVVFPERGGADNNRGRVELPFNVGRAGPYAVWIRARWDNQCGNSVMLDIDESRGHAAGEDDVYGTWHWVRAGRYTLAAGMHRVVLSGREDGIALDEVLFTPDPAFVPGAAALGGPAQRDLRRSADAFDRSPGHGLEPWRAVTGRWDIAFTLDPNRVPEQYALTGRPATNGAEAVVILQADAWRGVRLAFSFLPQDPGEFGAVVERSADGSRAIAVRFLVSGDGAQCQVDGPGGVTTRCALGSRMRLGQWQRVVIERWAWVLRVSVDGSPVLTTYAFPPAEGAVGFLVRSGLAVFDDVSVEEIPWQAEDGAHTIPWVVQPGARWERVATAHGGGLVGRRGEILAGLDGLPVRAVMIEEASDADTCRVAGATLREIWREPVTRLFEASPGEGDSRDRVSVTPSRDRAALRRIAIAYGAATPDLYVEGPYHFTSEVMEDLADYLDFTPDEQRQTADPAQADKLRREKKTFCLVGRGEDGSAWAIEEGRWRVSEGALVAMTPGSVRHWRDFSVGMELRARISLSAPASAARIDLYAGVDPAVRVSVGAGDGASARPGTNGVALQVPSDGTWHDLSVRVAGDRLEASVDGAAPARADVRRGVGGTIRLVNVAGQVCFDDIRFIVPRARPGVFPGTPAEFLYAFDRRETDWRREGGAWIDHGGIACALASQWISLIAPKGRGVLWNGRVFAPNLLVALTVEENTEWFGWQQNPSHQHHAYDNINVILAAQRDWDSGYRLEVNGRGHTATVLYRLGVPVATVAQDARFPMTYVGGHQPYEPRRNRIALVRTGARLRAFVNGVEVLGFVDHDPLRVTCVGVGGHDTRANFSRVEIRELP
jgi:hypothetical protein